MAGPPSGTETLPNWLIRQPHHVHSVAVRSKVCRLRFPSIKRPIEPDSIPVFQPGMRRQCDWNRPPLCEEWNPEYAGIRNSRDREDALILEVADARPVLVPLGVLLLWHATCRPPRRHQFQPPWGAMGCMYFQCPAPPSSTHSLRSSSVCTFMIGAPGAGTTRWYWPSACSTDALLLSSR